MAVINFPSHHSSLPQAKLQKGIIIIITVLCVVGKVFYKNILQEPHALENPKTRALSPAQLSNLCPHGFVIAVKTGTHYPASFALWLLLLWLMSLSSCALMQFCFLFFICCLRSSVYRLFTSSFDIPCSILVPVERGILYFSPLPSTFCPLTTSIRHRVSRNNPFTIYGFCLMLLCIFASASSVV